MNVVLLKESHEETVWDHFVLGHPQASGYHTLAWRRVISNVFGHRTFYLMAKDEGHGFRKKQNQDFQFYTTVEFLQEYLLK